MGPGSFDGLPFESGTLLAVETLTPVEAASGDTSIAPVEVFAVGVTSRLGDAVKYALSGSYSMRFPLSPITL